MYDECHDSSAMLRDAVQQEIIHLLLPAGTFLKNLYVLQGSNELMYKGMFDVLRWSVVLMLQARLGLFEGHKCRVQTWSIALYGMSDLHPLVKP